MSGLACSREVLNYLNGKTEEEPGRLGKYLPANYFYSVCFWQTAGSTTHCPAYIGADPGTSARHGLCVDSLLDESLAADYRLQEQEKVARAGDLGDLFVFYNSR